MAEAELKTVLITGANRGLGLGFVKYYLGKYWSVFACVRHTEKCQELKSLVNASEDNLSIKVLDVSEPSSIDAFTESFKKHNCSWIW